MNRQGARIAKYATVVFVVGIAVGLPWVLASSYQLHVAILACWFAYLATCWNIVGGYAGQPSFGHAVFVGSGGYCSAQLFIQFGLSPWIGMWIGGMVAATLGAFLGFISFRYRVKGHFFLLVTIAFAQFFYVIVLNTPALRGASGFSLPLKGHAPWLFQFESKIYYFYIILFLLLFVVALSVILKESRAGYYWRSIKSNENAAEAIGINVMSYKMIALILSSFLSGVGGAFYAQYMVFIEPEGLFGIGLSAEIVVFAIVGGVGSAIGPALGAILLHPLAEILRATLGAEIGGVHLIVYGILLIVVILFMPEGIAGAGRLLLSKLKYRMRPLMAYKE